MKTKLLRDAAEWRLISLLFECPSGDWHQQVKALAGEVGDAELKAAAANCAEASESLYYSTFGPGGPAAPREVSHRQTLQPGQMLDEIGAYYQAFAYQPTTSEPPDHIAVMTGFIAYLRLKEAYGNAEQAEVTAKAAKQFVDDHLNLVAEPLAKSLSHSGIAYLAQASHVLLKRVGPSRRSADSQPVAVDSCAAGCAWEQEAEG